VQAAERTRAAAQARKRRQESASAAVACWDVTGTSLSGELRVRIRSSSGAMTTVGCIARRATWTPHVIKPERVRALDL